MSIHREGKKYRVRWRQGNQQRSRSFDRRADADLFEAELRRRRQLGPTLARDVLQATITLDEFVRTGFRTHAATLAPATRRHYRWALETHLTGLLHVPLAAIDVPMLASLQHRLLEQGRTPSTVRQAMTRLSGILQIAVEHGLIPANPARAVRKIAAGPREEVRPLEPTQLEQLLTALTGRDRTIVMLGGYFGLRPKEIRLALWESVGEKTFRVGRARTKSTAARTRTLSGPTAAFHELRAWRLAAGVPATDLPIIGPTTESVLNQWAWKTLRPLAMELWSRDDVSLYTLRHTHASALAYCGFTVTSAARRMGHSPELYLRTYSHVIDALEDRPQFTDLDALIADARTKTPTIRRSESL